MAKLSQKAENQWVAMNCGIMDQLISAAGEKDHALFIDCRSLETTAVALPQSTVIVVMDTATRHEHVGGEYNVRRQQCEEAAKFFDVVALRDVTLAQFEDKAKQLEDVIMRRARHVITENERTLQAMEATHHSFISVAPKTEHRLFHSSICTNLCIRRKIKPHRWALTRAFVKLGENPFARKRSLR